MSNGILMQRCQHFIDDFISESFHSLIRNGKFRGADICNSYNGCTSVSFSGQGEAPKFDRSIMESTGFTKSMRCQFTGCVCPALTRCFRTVCIRSEQIQALFHPLLRSSSTTVAADLALDQAQDIWVTLRRSFQVCLLQELPSDIC